MWYTADRQGWRKGLLLMSFRRTIMASAVLEKYPELFLVFFGEIPADTHFENPTGSAVLSLAVPYDIPYDF